MIKKDELVYGERIGDLLPALLAVRDAMTIDDDGRARWSVELEPDVCGPLRRALMRCEAELLRNDADAVGPADETDRTYEQRAADAFVHLVVAIGDTCD